MTKFLEENCGSSGKVMGADSHKERTKGLICAKIGKTKINGKGAWAYLKITTFVLSGRQGKVVTYWFLAQWDFHFNPSLRWKKP